MNQGVLGNFFWKGDNEMEVRKDCEVPSQPWGTGDKHWQQPRCYSGEACGYLLMDIL